MLRTRFWTSISTTQDVDSALPAAVKSAARAFRVMEFFDEIRRSARANEIADRLGFPQSSTSVLLTSLVRLGYLDFDIVARTYFPSLRVAMLGSWLDRGHFRDGSIMNALENLSDDTGLAISLSTRSGIHVRYLHAIQAKSAGSLHITLSTRRYAVWSSAGIMLLAETPEAEVRAILRRTRAEPDAMAKSINTRDVFSHIAAARAQGYFLSDGLVTPRAGALSVRLPDRVTGQWQAIALSVAGDRAEIRNLEVELVARMRALIDALE